MSETSQGPGWWIASDGRWYPPELHPSATAQMAPSAVPEAVHASVGAPVGAPSGFGPVGTPLGGSGPSADIAPPATLVGVPASGNGHGPIAPDALPEDTAPATPTPSRGTRKERRRRPRRVIYGVAAVVLFVAGAALGEAFLVAHGGGIPLGQGTAVVNWQSSVTDANRYTAVSGTAHFAGTAGGKSFSGTASLAPGSQQLFNGQNGNLPAEIPYYLYKGTFGGTNFSVTISLRTSELQQGFSNSDGTISILYIVSGTYGNEPVDGTIQFAQSSDSTAAPTGELTAHIGSLTVFAGIHFATLPDGQFDSATANYNVVAS